MARPASSAAAGTGTPSGPVAPAAGAGWRAPSVLSGARLSPGVAPLTVPEPPPVTARMIPATTAITTAAVRLLVTRIRRRRRRACSARSRAILSRAARLFLALGTGSCPSPGLASSGDRYLAAEDAVAEPARIGQVEPAARHRRAE